MATGISSAEKLPDADYSRSHRPPPIPPTFHEGPLANSINNTVPRQQNTSEDASVHSSSSRSHRRRRSFSALLRRGSSQHSVSRQAAESEDIPPVPAIPLPATRIAQVQQAAQYQQNYAPSRPSESSTYHYPQGADVVSSSRKISFEMLRKSSKLKQQEKERLELERLARQHAPPPRLQDIEVQPSINTFGGEDADYNNVNGVNDYGYARSNISRPAQSSYSNSSMPGYNSSSSPAYAVRSGVSPPTNGNGEYVERHESMTNRGRYSYASSTGGMNVNSPRRVRRRKDPTPFNILVVGAKNSGKTSFINFLRHSLALPAGKSQSAEPDATVNNTKSSFTSQYCETEMEGERVGLTLWDSAGLEKNIVDLQLREMSTFVESKFEETFVEEQKVMRSPGVKDTHIHCVFLVLDPVRLDTTVAASQKKGNVNLASVSGLDDDLDLQVMRSLWGKTTVIPVISKADTLTIGHMNFLKRAVWHSIRTAKMDPLEALELEDDMEEEDEDNSDDADVQDGAGDSDSSGPLPTPKKKSHRRTSSLTLSAQDDETPYIPMSILSPDPYDLPPYAPRSKAEPGKVGRRFPWGFADPYNPEHCDFTRLRDSIFLEWRGEIRELSKTRWYENWRTSRLRNLGLPGSGARRLKGGVTPVGVVPKEGRVVSPNSKMMAQGGSGVPRSVSGGSVVVGGGMSKAERMMGMTAEESQNVNGGAEGTRA